MAQDVEKGKECQDTVGGVERSGAQGPFRVFIVELQGDRVDARHEADEVPTPARTGDLGSGWCDHEQIFFTLVASRRPTNRRISVSQLFAEICCMFAFPFHI